MWTFLFFVVVVLLIIYSVLVRIALSYERKRAEAYKDFINTPNANQMFDDEMQTGDVPFDSFRRQNSEERANDK